MSEDDHDIEHLPTADDINEDVADAEDATDDEVDADDVSYNDEVILSDEDEEEDIDYGVGISAEGNAARAQRRIPVVNNRRRARFPGVNNYRRDLIPTLNNRRQARPPPMPTQILRCVKMSSFVTNHTSSTQTIQFHVASIILPQESLSTITDHEVEYPVFFQITNSENGKSTVCGVVQFTADPGTCSIPDWVMDNLDLQEGVIVTVELQSLEQGTFVKLEPQSVKFLDIKDPKAVLEDTLRKFSCISEGDIIPVTHDGDVHLVKVLETKPSPSMKITNSDIHVDFAPPADYIEPNNNTKNSESFPGIGQSLNGQINSSVDSSTQVRISRGAPNWSFKVGCLEFDRRPKSKSTPVLAEANAPFKPFTGTGFSTGQPSSDVKKQSQGENKGKHCLDKTEDMASGATANKISRNGDVLDVFEASEMMSQINSVQSLIDVSDLIDDTFDTVSSDDEDETEDEESEPDDPNDPDYNEGMDIE